MSKKIVKQVKLQFPGGELKPGPTLASIGVNIMEFCKAFNEATKDKKGDIIPALITVYNDKSFIFEIKTSPTSILIKKFANIEKAASNSLTEEAGFLTDSQITEIAKIKMPDLNTEDVEQAKKIIIGTMKRMGIKQKN